MSAESRLVRPAASLPSKNATAAPRVGFLPRLAGAVVTCAVLLSVFPGCSRNFWRSQADFDTYNQLLIKTRDPRWDLPRLTVDADSRSRFYDPYDLAKPPLPPDDPSANEYMYMMDGMRGYKSWHKFGQLMSVENPQWLENIGFSPKVLQASWETIDPNHPDPIPSIFNLTLPQAIELANIHNREYQTNIENVYLAALALTYEHFQFNVRYLGRNRMTPTASMTYIDIPNTSDTLSTTARGGISQLLPTGGQWAAELANNTLWLFSGGNSSSSSILSFSLTQPLLQGAGRKIVMEGLTQQERNVLYAVRDLAHYRRTFFSNIVVPNPAGGFLGQLFTVQQIENQRENIRALVVQIERLREIYNVEPSEDVDDLPDNLIVPDVIRQKLFVTPSERKISLIWNGAIITEAEREALRGLDPAPAFAAMIEELIEQVDQKAPLPGVSSTTPDLNKILTSLQVPDELRGRLEIVKPGKVSWRGLMTDEEREVFLGMSQDPAFREMALDLAARVRSGTIPLDLAQLLTRLAGQEVQLRNLEQQLANQQDQFKFELGLPTDMQLTVDTSLIRQFQLIDPRLTDRETQLLGFVEALAKLRIDQADDVGVQIVKILPEIREMIRVVEQDGFEIVEEDFRRVEANMDRRLAELSTDAEKLLVQRNIERDQFMFRDARKKFDRFKADFEEINQEIATGRISPEDVIGDLRSLRENLLQSLQSLKVIQVGLRSELIKLEDFSLSIEEVVAIAVENRLELMNVRGAVMDARRQLEITANRLQGVLNVVGEADVGTSGGNRPFDFRGDQSAFRAGLQFSAPLDQVLQRNDFRVAIINYQRARREYMRIEDRVKREVRDQWRVLAVLKPNFETTRQNLRFSAMQLDSAIESTAAPPAAGSSGRAGGGGAGGLNLQNALQSVLQAQNDLIRIWIQYEQNRINIYRDMDIMQVDERGLWVDPVYQNLADRPNPPASEPANELPPLPITRADSGLPEEPEWLVRLLSEFSPTPEERADWEGAAVVGAGARGDSGGGVVRLADDRAERDVRETLEPVGAGN